VLFARGIRLQTGVNASPISIPDTYARYRPGNIGDRFSLSLSLSTLPPSGAITNKARFALRIKPGFARRKNARGSNSSEHARARAPRVPLSGFATTSSAAGNFRQELPRRTAQHERIQFRDVICVRFRTPEKGARCFNLGGEAAREEQVRLLGRFIRSCVENALAEGSPSFSFR